MSTAADGRRRRTVASRTAILEAAERLFGQSGFTSTSLRGIAAAIWMSHAGVLRHFASKGDLLLAVLQRLEPGNDVFALLGEPALPRAELLRRLLEHTASQKAALTLRMVLLGEATDAAHPAHGFVRDRLELVEFELGLAMGTDGVDLLAVWNGLQLIHRYVPSIDPVTIGVRHADAAAPVAERPAATIVAPLKHGAAAAPVTRPAQIVAAATSAFSRAGYRSTSLRDIGSELGLSHTALLYHFPSKESLLEAVLDERDRDESLPWSIGDGPLDYLNGMYLQALHNVTEPGLSRLYSTLASEATDLRHPAHDYFAHRYLRFHAELAGVLVVLGEQGLARDGLDAEGEAWSLIALWDGLALRGFYLADERGLPERVRTRINSLLRVHISKADITVGQDRARRPDRVVI